MTKAVKVFRGVITANSLTTIYTVPAGRVAKVTFSLLRNYYSGGSGEVVELVAGGVTLFSRPATIYGQGFPCVWLYNSSQIGGIVISDDSYLGGDFSEAGGQSTTSSIPQVIPKHIYLGAGDTVAVRYAKYSFMVVEEY